MDLSKYIGEGTLYDKKEKLEKNRPMSWLKTVSAFANGKGGALIFGIADDESLVGLAEYKKDSEVISEMIKTKMDPVPNISLEHFIEGDKNFIVLRVYQGEQTPYYFIEGGSRAAFIRVGNESIPATSIDLRNLVLRGVHQTYDTLTSEKSLSQASFTRLKAEYMKRTGKEFKDSDFLSFGLVNGDGLLTNAGALFADEYLVYQSRIFCTRWNGLDKANGLMDALDDEEFEGNIIYLLQAAMDFVKRNTKKMWKKGPVHRINYPEYPERAVQEGLVNALIHRDYSVIGSEVHLDIYDDRIEIYSPGGMYDGSFVQNVDPYNISSVRRNPILADLFARMNLMERRGSGLRKIIETYEFEKHYKEELKPEFRSTESSFFTILKNLNYEGQSVGKNVDKNVGKKLKPDDRRKQIIEIIKDKSQITAQDLSEIFSVSERTIERDLKILTDKKAIEYIGSAKDGYWIAKK